MRKKILCWGVIIFTIISNISFSKPNIRNLGDKIQIVVPTYALGMTMMEEDYEGTKQFVSGFVSTQLTVEALKRVTQKPRPDYVEGNNKHSFPSGHSAAAFSGATFIHKRYGIEKAIVPYALASFVAYSRVYANKHYVDDVIFGALISSFFTWTFTDKYNSNLLINIGKNEFGFNYRINF